MSILLSCSVIKRITDSKGKTKEIIMAEGMTISEAHKVFVDYQEKWAGQKRVSFLMKMRAAKAAPIRGQRIEG